jgi:hypothetical protein
MAAGDAHDGPKSAPFMFGGLMKIRSINLIAAGVMSLGMAATCYVHQSSMAADAPQPDQAAVERARKLVRILDDVYKQTIVLITDKYVNSEKDFPAGSAAVALFATLSKSGSHEARLIDATGEPYEPKNTAQDEFEKEGIRRLKAGEAGYDKIVQQDGRYKLRAITPVPVVMKKCVMCHAHYADAKPGEPIGAIVYTIPLE